MLIYFIALMAAAVALFGLQPRREANRWAAFFLLFASIGGLAGTLRETKLTVPIPPGGLEAGAPLLSGTVAILEWINHTLTPYGVLVFAIVYAGAASQMTRRRLKLLLTAPVWATLVMMLADGDARLPFWFLLAWAGPYYLAACWLLIWGAVRERSAAKRKEKTAVAVLAVPTLLAILICINLAFVVAPGFPYFRYVSVFIAYSLLAGIAFAFGSGVLGLKVRVERDPLESAMKAVGAGTAMMNHAIKNEAAKISMSMDTIRNSLRDADGEIKEQLDLIARSSDRMMRLVSRIHSQTKELELVLHRERLVELADECLERMEPELARNGITVRKHYEDDPEVLCDAIHMSEVLLNIVRNAIEAMPQGGTLDVRIRRMKRTAELTVCDSGIGIPADMLPLAVEPFFTTKAGNGNFGLGLTYCYNVMRKSGGSLTIENAKPHGTSVKLAIPLDDRKEAGA